MGNPVLGKRVIIENVPIPVSEARFGTDCDAEAAAEASKIIQRVIGRRPYSARVHKKSVDARRRGSVRFVYSVCADLECATGYELEKLKAAGAKILTDPSFDAEPGSEKAKGRIVIAGFGPAGMFCALELAKRGYRPVVYERGSCVADRVRKVESFLSGGELDPNCNVQFGAGGAGTFSDGKLTTRINDPAAAYVLERLVSLGAPEDVLWQAKPHIGTDILRSVVENADACVREAGGEIFYDTPVCLSGGTVRAGGQAINASALVLAVGHSARDTYRELMTGGFSVVPKAFSCGVRIEHEQAWLDRAMYGDLAEEGFLPHADYSLSLREGDRGVYSFCMCPGGTVVAASDEEGGIVTNGMSNRNRDGRNANSALAVSVLPSDFGSTPDGAIAFQRNLERAAYAAGGGAFYAPVQLVPDFLEKRQSRKLGSVAPTYMGGRVTPCDLRSVLPGFISGMLERGLYAFDKKIPGFAGNGIPLTGVETRTSSPVRILRNENLEAVGVRNVYPCGEGAGYAGGIVSAAVDGLRVARAIITRFSPD
ncbi:MAG: hypothetical protein IJM71_06465 [Clostridia bacterium]|nr:hypothetical protein [Clostridia bacterium]